MATILTNGLCGSPCRGNLATCMRELTDGHPGRTRQSVDPFGRHVVPRLLRFRSTSRAAPIVVSLCPQARQLGQYVEIEIGVLRSHAWIGGERGLAAQIAACGRQRNAGHARMKWMFKTEKARAKM